MFEYRRQPFAALFVLYTIIVTLFIRLPYWFVTSLSTTSRGRPSWSIGRVIVIRVLQTTVRTWYATSLPSAEDPEKAAKSARTTGFVWLDPTPELVVGEIAQLAQTNNVEPKRVSGYWYGARDSDGKVGQRAGLNEKVIIHFHGGGYVTGTSSPSDLMCPVICNGYIQHFTGITRVFAVEYRIASASPFTPANHFPTAVVDALAGYAYLIRNVGFHAENIIVSGDSAGAHLAFSLTRHLIQSAFKDIPPPSNLLLLSPTVEWLITHVGPKSSEQRNKDCDYCRPFFDGYAARSITGNMLEDAAYTNLWVSPASLRIKNFGGWFSDFPRTCISAGEAEFQLDSMTTFRERLIQDIGTDKVTYIETYGATHDFLGFSMHEPERTDALKAIAKWIEGC